MHKYLSLTKTLVKCSVGMLTDGKNKKSMSVFLYSIILLSLIPIMFVIFTIVQSTLEALGPLDQAALPMGMMILMATMIIFFFSIFLIPSLFYFSSDNLTLLTLPLKPVHIIGAKFTVCVLYEYAFAAAILLPTFAAYAQFANPNVLYYIFALIVLLLVPIFPLVFSTILIILIMRFVPFFKNRDRFNLIAGIVGLVVAFSFSFMSGSFTSVGSEEQLMNMFLQGDNSLLNLLSQLFPSVSLFAKALCANDILSFLLAILITIASIFVLLTLGKYLYFKGAIGFGETSSNSKKLSEKDMNKANRSHSKIRTYALKEFKIILRTPVYFLNCVTMCIIMPILVFFLPMMSGGTASLDGLDIAKLIDRVPDFPAYLIIVGIGIGFLMGGMNLVSSTSISREGAHYEYMKYIPMSYRDQIHAKMLSGIFLGILTIVLTLVSLFFIVPVNILYYLILFVPACVSTIWINIVGMFIDMLHPKLVWEQEAAAVKQNMGGVITIFAGFALAAILILSCLNLPDDSLMMGSIILLLVIGILTILGWIGIGKVAEKMIRKL